MSKANKIFEFIAARSWVANISDERAQGNSIIVTLKEGWFFNEDTTCGVRGFDTVRATAMGTSKNAVNNPTLVKPQKVKKPKVEKVSKTIPVVAEIPVDMKPTKSLSMSKDAIRKREARAAAKAAKEAQA